MRRIFLDGKSMSPTVAKYLPIVITNPAIPESKHLGLGVERNPEYIDGFFTIDEICQDYSNFTKRMVMVMNCLYWTPDEFSPSPDDVKFDTDVFEEFLIRKIV